MFRLLRTTPWTRAPLLAARQPAVALAVAVTVALLGLATASYPLYLASSASGAFAIQVAERCPDGLDASVTGSGPVSGTQAATEALGRRSDAALVSAGASRSDLQSPVVTLDAAGIGVRLKGRTTSQNLVQVTSRTGAVDNITVLSSVGGPGVWLPDDLAKSIGAKAGSQISLAQDTQGSEPVPPPGSPDAEVRVAGIYRSLVGTVLPRYWCTQTGIFGTFDANFPPPPVVIAPQTTLIGILGTLKVSELTSYQWERTLTPGINVPQATKVLTALEHLSSSIGVVPRIREGFVELPIGGGITGASMVVNELSFIVAHADAIEHALRGGILPVSLAGLAVSALLVAAAGSYWVDRRRVEVALLSSRGAGPAALGGKAALENLFPVVAGALAGWAAASGLVVAIGPSASLPASSRIDGLWASLAGGVFALLLVWLVAGLRVRSSAVQRIGRSGLARVPFELVPLGFSIWAWSTLGQPSLQANGTSAPGVGAAFLAFPILFLLSLAALAARIAMMILSARWFRRATAGVGKPGWLASRRLAGAPRIAALCLASTAAAVGVLLYGSALTSSQNATIHAKAAVFVGSTTSVQLGLPGPIPAALASTTTEVLSVPNDQLGGQEVDVIGIDPKTFAGAAFWDSSFSDVGLQTLLNRISGSAAAGTPLPVIVAGTGTAADQAAASVSLRLSDYGIFTAPIPVTVVGTAAEFPGQNGIDPLVVTTTSSLRRLGAAGSDVLWSRQSDQQVLASLRARGRDACDPRHPPRRARPDDLRRHRMDVRLPAGARRPEWRRDSRRTAALRIDPRSCSSARLRAVASDGTDAKNPSAVTRDRARSHDRPRSGARRRGRVGRGRACAATPEPAAEPQPSPASRAPVPDDRGCFCRRHRDLGVGLRMGPARG